MVGRTDNDRGSISISSGDVRGLRALLQIANDKRCAEGTRELARLGLTGYLCDLAKVRCPALRPSARCDQHPGCPVMDALGLRPSGQNN
jgi:hypothetical protein